MGKELKRMNYFNRLFLESEDYNQDKEYQRRLQGFHNRYLHNWGIISGLDVKPVTDSNMEVYVTEGAAMDLTAEGLDGSNIEESISRQILIYEGHPDNPIDLSEYNAGDNIYIFVRYLECNADWECERGQGEEIHIWERGCLSSSLEMPEDNKKNILLARIIPKEVRQKAGSITTTETIIDSSCIFYTDTDGSPLRAYAGPHAKVLALKEFIFEMGNDINEMPFIRASLEKTESSLTFASDSASAAGNESVFDRDYIKSKLKTIVTDFRQVVQDSTAHDQNELSAALDITKLGYLENLINNKQLVRLLKNIMVGLTNLKDIEIFVSTLDGFISDLDNMLINVNKTDRQDMADILKKITDDLEKLIYSENTTNRDKAVNSMLIIKSDLEECAENIITTEQEVLTAALGKIKSGFTDLKKDINVIELEGDVNILGESTNCFIAFSADLGELDKLLKQNRDSLTGLVNNKKFAEAMIRNLESFINSANENGKQRLEEILKKIAVDLADIAQNTTNQDDVISRLEKISLYLAGIVTFDRKDHTDILKKIICDLEDCTEKINTFERNTLADTLNKIESNLENLIAQTEQKKLAEMLNQNKAYLTECMSNNTITDYKKLTDLLKSILSNFKNLVNDTDQKMSIDVLKTIICDLISRVKQTGHEEFICVLKEKLATLLNLENQKELTDMLEKAIDGINENVLKDSDAVKLNLKELIDEINKLNQDVLKNSTVDLLNCINKEHATNRQALLYVLKKDTDDLVNLINNDAAGIKENIADYLDIIRSDFAKCTENAAKIKQSELITVLEEFKSAFTNLQDNNQKEFTALLKKIVTDLKNLLNKVTTADVQMNSDIDSLSDLINNMNETDIDTKIATNLKKIKLALEESIKNEAAIDQKDLMNSVRDKLESGLSYLNNSIEKKLIDSLAKAKSDLDKCTENTIVTDKEELVGMLNRFKSDIVYLGDKTDRTRLADLLKRISAGLAEFINKVKIPDNEGFVYKLKKNVSDSTENINNVKTKNLNEESVSKLKTDLEKYSERVIVIDQADSMALLKKLQSDLAYLKDEPAPKEAVNSLKTVTSDLVNFVFNINDANNNKLTAQQDVNTSDLVKLINNVKEADPEEEVINKVKKIKSDFEKCSKNLITISQNALRNEPEKYMKALDALYNSIEDTNQNDLSKYLKQITSDLVNFINSVNKTGQGELSDALRAAADKLVSITNKVNLGSREELGNSLEIKAVAVNFTNNVSISKDVEFENLVSKKKDGTVKTEFELAEEFIQLNSSSNATKGSWKAKDGGMDVFRGGSIATPDARILWSESGVIWKAGFENKLSPIVFGNKLDKSLSDNNLNNMLPAPKWQDLINEELIDGLHRHSRLSSQKSTVLSVDDEGDITLYGDMAANDRNIKGFSGGMTWLGSGMTWYCSGKLAEKIVVDGPVLYGSKGGMLGTASDGQSSVLSWNSSGKVGIGAVNLSSTADDLDIAGSCRMLVGSNPIRITSKWTAFPDLTINQAEICNDTTYHKALMFVGNQSAGQGRKVSVYDWLDVNGLLYVNGSMQMKGALTVCAGEGDNGIIFPSDPGGGWGDGAWIKYYPRSGEACTLEIGTSNDGDDNIVLLPSGNVGINNWVAGTYVNSWTPNDKLDVVGTMRVLSGLNPVRFTNKWSGFPEISSKNAEISNDISDYKSLMIVGNRSGGNERRVSIWDDLDVNGPLVVKGKFQVAGAIVPGVGNCELKGIMFPKDPAGGLGDCAWIRYYSDTIRGGGENMTLEIGISNDSNLETTTTRQWVSTCPSYPNDTSTRYCGYYRSTTRTFFGNNGDRLRFRASGGTYIAGNFYITSSKEYKENISKIGKKEMKNAIENLEPVQFNFRGNYNKTTLGFIAEDVPDCVAAPDKKAISPMEIITILVGEVKEQEKALNDLKKQISKLKRYKKQ